LDTDVVDVEPPSHQPLAGAEEPSGEIDRKHKGAWAELVACAWLLGRGYDVFRNVSQHGLADVVATNAHEVLRIDVKLATQTTRPVLSAEQIASGVIPLYVLSPDQCELGNPPRRDYDREAVCAGCKQTFSRRRCTQRFCSPECRGQDWRAAHLDYMRDYKQGRKVG
jgi:hypothetical protein